MSINSIGLFLLILAASSAPGAPAASPHLRKLIGLRAENGILALDGSVLSVFSPLSISLQDPATGRWRPAEKKSDALSIKIEHLGWQELARPLPPSSASGFALCDRLNQIDEGSTDSRAQKALPKGAKVKSIVQLNEDLVLAVYSTSSDTVRYDIRVALLLDKAPDGYSKVDDDLATEDGNYCGLQSVTGDVYLVLVDEPSGSSDFSAVYAYALAPGDRGQ